MIGGVVGFDGAKGADSDVESEKGVVDLGEDFGGEVKAGGGGGDGSFFFGIDGLVAMAVRLVSFPFHVVGEGEVAVFFEVRRAVPADEAFALFIDLDDLAKTACDGDSAADFHFFAGSDEAPPVERVGGVSPNEFDGLVIREEACGDDLGVI